MWGSNSRPHAYMASILPTELSSFLIYKTFKRQRDLGQLCLPGSLVICPFHPVHSVCQGWEYLASHEEEEKCSGGQREVRGHEEERGARTDGKEH